eukprot:6212471-Pleurochrysis_carterae.AAC.2
MPFASNRGPWFWTALFCQAFPSARALSPLHPLLGGKDARAEEHPACGRAVRGAARARGEAQGRVREQGARSPALRVGCARCGDGCQGGRDRKGARAYCACVMCRAGDAVSMYCVRHRAHRFLC